MSLEIITNDEQIPGVVRLAVGQDMTIYAIEGLKQALSEEIFQADSIELDLSRVEEFDSSGIQLLLALKREFEQKHKVLKIIAASEVVRQFIEHYGLTNRLLQEAIHE